MDELDAITLLKRRARLLNKITAPAVDRSMQALFAPYRPPPAIPPPPVIPVAAAPPPFQFQQPMGIREQAEVDAARVLASLQGASLPPPEQVAPEVQQGRRDAQFVREMASIYGRQDGPAFHTRSRDDDDAPVGSRTRQRTSSYPGVRYPTGSAAGAA